MTVVGLDLRYILRETPLGYFLVTGAGLAMLLLCLGLTLGALRGGRLRRARAGEPAGRFSWAAELVTVAAALLVPALIVASVQIARGQVHAALGATDPSQKVTFIARGVAGQLNALALGGQVLVLLLPLAGAALGLLLARRAQLGGLRRATALAASRGEEALEVRAWRAHPGPGVGHLLPLTLGAGVLGAGLCTGVLTWCTDLIRSFSAVAGVDPADKARLLVLGMDEARPALERIPPVLGVAALALAVVALFVLDAPARARRRIAPELAPGLSWTATLVGAGACLAAAAICALLALPYRAENHDPLPVKLDGGHVLAPEPGIELPPLEGPDRLERAPVLTVRSQEVSIEGQRLDRPARLAEQLEVLRHNWKLINPGRDFPGELLLLADHRVRFARLAPWLRAARGAGYAGLALGFMQSQTLERPLLGRIVASRESAARLDLGGATPGAEPHRFSGAPPAGSGPLLLEPPPELGYDRLARVVVQARRARRAVTLLLP